MPLFSLVLPTLRRPDTFQHALQTLISQTHGDFEIVVQNNGRDKRTEDIVASFSDDRIKHFWCDEVLPMSRNWELALSNARGNYITFIGDDDGLLHDACRIASTLIARTKAEIISWRPFSFYWDSHIIPERKNRLLAHVDLDVAIELIDSRRQLVDFYDFKLHYSHLPMIYNSFVSRAVVDRVIEKAGRYFLGVTPDVTSGIVNAACSQKFVLFNQPLSVAGLSGHSTGHNVTLSPPGWISAQQVKTSLGDIHLDARLVPTSNNLEMLLASDALLVRDILFPNDMQLTMDFRRLAQSVASAINERPGFYAETKHAVEQLAGKHGFPVSDIAFPAQAPQVSSLKPGKADRGKKQTLHIVDCKAASIAHIGDAVSYVEDVLLPRLDDIENVPVAESNGDRVPLVNLKEKLSFSSKGNGVRALEYGWGLPEAWGTWSVNSYTLLRLKLSQNEATSIAVECCMRAFLYRAHNVIDFECRTGNTVLFQKRITRSGSNVYRWDFLASSLGIESEMELEFRINQPRSPAELGANADTRLLGVGLEWIRLSGSK